MRRRFSFEVKSTFHLIEKERVEKVQRETRVPVETETIYYIRII